MKKFFIFYVGYRGVGFLEFVCLDFEFTRVLIFIFLFVLIIYFTVGLVFVLFGFVRVCVFDVV